MRFPLGLGLCPTTAAATLQTYNSPASESVRSSAARRWHPSASEESGSDRVAQVRRLLDVLEEEMRDPLIMGVDEWDMERTEAPVIATGCEY